MNRIESNRKSWRIESKFAQLYQQHIGLQQLHTH
jgi:hypothetical protein